MPTVAELAALVGGEHLAECGVLEISGPAALAEARPGEISFFGHPRYASDLKTTRASAVFVPRDFAGETPAACIRVEDPSAAFTAVTHRFVPVPVAPLPGVHPSATVDPTAKIAPGSCVQAQAVIEAPVVILARTRGSARGACSTPTPWCGRTAFSVTASSCIAGW